MNASLTIHVQNAPQHEKIEQFEKAFNELQGVIDRANS